MNRFISNRNVVLYGLLLITLSVVAVFGETKAEAPKPKIPEIVKLQQSARASAKERRAEEAYEKRNVEVTPWVDDSEPSNQDNAALLYYQAFLLRPELNTALNMKISEVLRGAESDRQIRTYLGHCLPMIEVVEIASRVPKCTWGIWHGPGPKFTEKGLRSEVSILNLILAVDARTLAADGHYRAALERCLTIRRLARHTAEESKLETISRQPDAMALRTTQYVLGVMPPDAEILTWFRGQLAVVQGAPLYYAEILQAEFKAYLNHVQTNPDPLKYMRKELIEKAENEQAKENARNLTDAQILSRARKPFPRFFDSIFRILDSEITYEQKCAQMQRLIDKLKEEEGTDPIVAHIINNSDIDVILGPHLPQFPYHVGRQAHINGIKAAIEVYLVVAKTGRLPKTLPDGLPKDPFTSRDFVYEITDEGFALRCQGEEFLERKYRLLEFKVKK